MQKPKNTEVNRTTPSAPPAFGTSRLGKSVNLIEKNITCSAFWTDTY